MAKLIRFDWAMKKLLRNKANFDILEGFLSELLKEDIKIQKILESESNRESAEDKNNRVDLLVENGEKELIIIEIQNDREYDYMQRILYGTSKAIAENMYKGMAYDKVKKVISVSIIYFDLGQGIDYVYVGTTNFIGLHTKDILQLSQTQIELYGQKEVYQFFPEYYLIKVNQFDEVAKDTLDEWIYFLKNSEVKDEFKAKGLAEAKEVLDIMRLHKEAQYGYNRYLDYLHLKASEVLSLKVQQEELMEKKIAEAEEKIRKDEKYKNSAEIAKKLIALGLDNNTIEKATGLTIEQIETLRKDKA